MKKLYSVQLHSPLVQSVECGQDDDYLNIWFHGIKKPFVIRAYHGQDCCESVYADFGNFEYQKKDIEGNKITGITIHGIRKMGMLITFHVLSGHDEKVLVPCYNEQNGYYSDSLELIVTNGEEGKERKIDLGYYKEDRIN